MIDKKEFKSIARDIARGEEKRETCIRKSRDILKLSKRTINAIHRDDMKSAKKFLDEIKKEKIKLERLSEGEEVRHYDIKVALQEYVEALAYFDFVTKGRLPSRKKLGVDAEPYLLGISDLTGELVRKSLNEVINDNYGFAVKTKEFIDGLHEQLSEMSLSGELRKKADMVRWNMNKIEDILFNAKMKGGV